MKVEELCQKVPDDLRPEAETLARAVKAMQKKIDQQISVYEQLPIAQTATTTQGEKILKNNPAMQEFRATVRDYAAALNALKNILDEGTEEVAASTLDDIRARFRVG